LDLFALREASNRRRLVKLPINRRIAKVPVPITVRAAEKYKTHTIVLGGKGESEINPELGSVALAVVKKARCSVLVAR